ncbi:hypothetical protein DFJ73DRAFT_20655 [Zopfochytrium polystomum]|nr:hypothetical protein DFJ73DRAFT_20655 [Zopfochytrium polystomum]
MRPMRTTSATAGATSTSGTGQRRPYVPPTNAYGVSTGTSPPIQPTYQPSVGSTPTSTPTPPPLSSSPAVASVLDTANSASLNPPNLRLAQNVLLRSEIPARGSSALASARQGSGQVPFSAPTVAANSQQQQQPQPPQPLSPLPPQTVQAAPASGGISAGFTPASVQPMNPLPVYGSSVGSGTPPLTGVGGGEAGATSYPAVSIPESAPLPPSVLPASSGATRPPPATAVVTSSPAPSGSATSSSATATAPGPAFSIFAPVVLANDPPQNAKQTPLRDGNEAFSFEGSSYMQPRDGSTGHLTPPSHTPPPPDDALSDWDMPSLLTRRATRASKTTTVISYASSSGLTEATNATNISRNSFDMFFKQGVNKILGHQSLGRDSNRSSNSNISGNSQGGRRGSRRKDLMLLSSDIALVGGAALKDSHRTSWRKKGDSGGRLRESRGDSKGDSSRGESSKDSSRAESVGIADDDEEEILVISEDASDSPQSPAPPTPPAKSAAAVTAGLTSVRTEPNRPETKEFTRLTLYFGAGFSPKLDMPFVLADSDEPPDSPTMPAVPPPPPPQSISNPAQDPPAQEGQQQRAPAQTQGGSMTLLDTLPSGKTFMEEAMEYLSGGSSVSPLGQKFTSPEPGQQVSQEEQLPPQRPSESESNQQRPEQQAFAQRSEQPSQQPKQIPQQSAAANLYAQQQQQTQLQQQQPITAYQGQPASGTYQQPTQQPLPPPQQSGYHTQMAYQQNLQQIQNQAFPQQPLQPAVQQYQPQQAPSPQSAYKAQPYAPQGSYPYQPQTQQQQQQQQSAYQPQPQYQPFQSLHVGPSSSPQANSAAPISAALATDQMMPRGFTLGTTTSNPIAAAALIASRKPDPLTGIQPAAQRVQLGPAEAAAAHWGGGDGRHVGGLVLVRRRQEPQRPAGDARRGRRRRHWRRG